MKSRRERSSIHIGGKQKIYIIVKLCKFKEKKLKSSRNAQKKIDTRQNTAPNVSTEGM